MNRERRESRGGFGNRAARRWLAALAIPLASVGCGNLTAGGFGEARVFVEGDGDSGPDPSAPAAVLQTNPDGAGVLARSGQNAFEGDVTVALRVFLRGELGVWTELTAGAQEVVVGVQGGARVELARQSIQAGHYDRVRLAFERIEANLTGGPPGHQLPPDGRIFVDVGDDPLEVERNVTVLLQSDDSIELTIDLRSGAWLRSAALDVVLPVQFRNALRITVD